MSNSTTAKIVHKPMTKKEVLSAIESINEASMRGLARKLYHYGKELSMKDISDTLREHVKQIYECGLTFRAVEAICHLPYRNGNNAWDLIKGYRSETMVHRPIIRRGVTRIIRLPVENNGKSSMMPVRITFPSLVIA